MSKHPQHPQPVRPEPKDLAGYHRSVMRLGRDDGGHMDLRYKLQGGASGLLNNVPNLSALVNKGSDSYNETLLHAAVRGGHQPTIYQLIQLGAPMLARTTQSDTPFDQFHRSPRGDVDDMVDQFARLVLLPALILESRELPEHLRQPYNEVLQLGGQEERFYHLGSSHSAMMTDARRVLFPTPSAPAKDYRGKPWEELKEDQFIRQFMRPLNLSRTWHHHAIAIPRKLRPYLTTRYWKPLLNEDFVTKDGYRITALTNSHALAAEGDALKHCVGKSTYDLLCCSEGAFRSHILSVRDPQGRPVSTLQVYYHNETPEQGGDYKGDIQIAGTSYRLNIRQHHGLYNGDPAREGTRAVDEFLEALKQPGQAARYLCQQPEELGEIVAKRETAAPGIIEEYIGYTPSWEHIEKVFNEFRRPERRASYGYRGTQLAYDDAIDPQDPQQFKHSLHFIDGYVLLDKKGQAASEIAGTREELEPKKGQRVVALRDLNLRDWLHATGLTQRIRHHLAYAADDINRRRIYAHEHQTEGIGGKIRKILHGQQLKQEREGLDADAAYIADRREEFHNEKLSLEPLPMADKPRDMRGYWQSRHAQTDAQNRKEIQGSSYYPR